VSLQTRLTDLVAAVGADIKSLQQQINGISVGSGPWTEEIRTTAATNNVIALADAFTGFAPAANTRYLVDIVASVLSNAATVGIQTQLTGPTTGITAAAVKIAAATSATADAIAHTGLNTIQANTAGLAVPSLVTIQAIIEVGASPGAGNIRMQYRPETATLMTVRAGSIMRWRTV